MPEWCYKELFEKILNSFSKCSHKFTDISQTCSKRFVIFGRLHIVVGLQSHKNMCRDTQRSLTQKSKLGIYRALAVHYIIQNCI